MEERLHKILANAGYGSRRTCEQLIDDGHVSLNGEIAQLGCKATVGKDDIRVDGRRLKVEKKVYFLVNKPPGYLCTNIDPAGRQRVGDLLVGVSERVYPVGRLDADSRGLVIMTNDGDLAARMTHPKFEVPKTYEVEVSGRVTTEDVERLTRGVWLSEGRTCRTRVRVLHRGNARSQLEITLREGRNRQVRRILARLGHKVRRLTRVKLGPLTLRGLGPGRFRVLKRTEVAALMKVGAEEHEKPRPRKLDKRKKPAEDKAPRGQRDSTANPRRQTKAASDSRRTSRGKSEARSDSRGAPRPNAEAKSDSRGARRGKTESGSDSRRESRGTSGTGRDSRRGPRRKSEARSDSREEPRRNAEASSDSRRSSRGKTDSGSDSRKESRGKPKTDPRKKPRGRTGPKTDPRKTSRGKPTAKGGGRKSAKGPGGAKAKTSRKPKGKAGVRAKAKAKPKGKSSAKKARTETSKGPRRIRDFTA